MRNHQNNNHNNNNNNNSLARSTTGPRKQLEIQKKKPSMKTKLLLHKNQNATDDG